MTVWLGSTAHALNHCPRGVWARGARGKVSSISEKQPPSLSHKGNRKMASETHLYWELIKDGVTTQALDLTQASWECRRKMKTS